MADINVRYLVMGLINDIICAFLINLGFGLLAPDPIPFLRSNMFIGQTELPGISILGFRISPSSIFEDMVWMNFFLGLFTTFFVSLGVRGDFKMSKITPPEWKRSDIAIIKLFPRNLILRSLIIGLVCILLFVPLTSSVFLLMKVTELDYWSFAILKGLYGILLTVPVSPIARISALGDRFFIK